MQIWQQLNDGFEVSVAVSGLFPGGTMTVSFYVIDSELIKTIVLKLKNRKSKE